MSLAKDTKGRGTYSFTTRWPGPVAEGKGKGSGAPDGVLWRTLDPERSVLRYGFATPSYVIGSAGLARRPRGVWAATALGSDARRLGASLRLALWLRRPHRTCNIV